MHALRAAMHPLQELMRVLIKLIFIVLSVFSLGRKDNAYAQTPYDIRHEKYSILPNAGTIFFDGTEIDQGYEDTNINYIPLLEQNKDENISSFRLIPENILDTLEVSKETDFDYSLCSNLANAILEDHYALYGLNTYVYENSNDIAPSIVFGIQSLPEVLEKKENGEIDNYFFQRGCSGGWKQYSLGIELNGIVSSNCISNDASALPGYKGGSSTSMPPQPTQCEDSTTIIKHLQGFKFGTIQELSNEQLKLYLTRVGCVSGWIKYYKNNGDILLGGDQGIFIGWKSDGNNGQNWIIGKQVETTDGIKKMKYEEQEIPFLIEESTSVLISGYVQYYFDCSQQTLDTPISLCPCLLTDDPRDFCKICMSYDTPTGCQCSSSSTFQYPQSICQKEKYCHTITDQDVSECECLDHDDPREICQICTAYDKPPDCKCSTQQIGAYPKDICEKEKQCHYLTDQTESQCPCIDQDPRAFCKICTGKDEPSAECICPEVAKGDYTKAQCDQDKLCHVLTGKTESQCPCIDEDSRAICYTCTAKDTPSAECKCPTSTTGDYTKEQCETDKAQTVDCTTPKLDTKSEVCPCPEKTDKTKWDADPRTVGKGICAASYSIHFTLYIVTLALLLPALALLF
ncbi:MAG: hypothetical protein EZS28_021101 [Streblomastix strix]|uniref:Uncharacterized protein n=1 Tax=Streblomastix strix TaxID=222440 RepID=A0A5J4VM76_9EUKA|nr:MAG: hypothetical protein EZS28_021101 [Streblomastix strix]